MAVVMTVYRLGSCNLAITFFVELSAYVMYGNVRHPVNNGGDWRLDPFDACASRPMELLSCMHSQQRLTSPTHQASVMLDLVITCSAVAQHCVKAHMQSQWRKPKFEPQ